MHLLSDKAYRQSDMPRPIALPPDIQSPAYQSHHFASGIRAHGGVLYGAKSARHMRWLPPYTAFVVLLAGELRFAINGERYHLSQSPSALLIQLSRPALFIREVGVGKIEKYTFTGLEPWLALRAQNSDFVLRQWQPQATTLAQVRNLFQPNFQPAGFAEEATLMQLLENLWQECQQAGHAPAAMQERYQDAREQSSRAALFERLEKAFAAGCWQVSTLAAALCISERTLNRRLQATLGISAAQWLAGQRMYRASLLLNQGNSIGEVAYACGYGSTASFTQAFRSYFGYPPKSYLQQK